MAGGILGFARDVVAGSPTDRSNQYARAEAFRIQGNQIFDELPPPPAPGVDPTTGIAFAAVPGGVSVAETVELVLTPDQGYRQFKGGQLVGPRYPATGPAPWPIHLPPDDLLGPGYTCGPSGRGGITCRSVERALPQFMPQNAASPYPGPLDSAAHRGTIFDTSTSDPSRAFQSPEGTPGSSTPIYGNTQRVFDDLKDQSGKLQLERDLLRQQLEQSSLREKELLAAQSAYAQNASQAAQNTGATGTVPAAAGGEGSSSGPSPTALLLVAGAVIVGLALVVS